MNKKVKFIVPIAHRLRTFLSNDMHVEINNGLLKLNDDKNIVLFENTSLICTLGDINLEVYFSYEKNILKKLVNCFLEGEEVPEDEYDEIQDSVNMEVANTVIGNVLINPNGKGLLDITPPSLVKKDHQFILKEKSTVVQSIIYTPLGNIKVITIDHND